MARKISDVSEGRAAPLPSKSFTNGGSESAECTFVDAGGVTFGLGSGNGDTSIDGGSYGAGVGFMDGCSVQYSYMYDAVD